MAEINTFSAAVDAVIQDTGRAEPRTQERIKRYVRASIRESNVLEFFYRDMTEEMIIAAGANPTWEKPDGFRIMRTVKYPIARYYPEFPPMIPPGKLQRDEKYYYYGASTYVVFVGIEKDDEVKFAYYSYPPSFVYYTAAERPAVYDDGEGITALSIPETSIPQWYYRESDGSYRDANTTTLTTEQQEAARDRVTNWLVFDWYHLVQEGGSAKTYKNLSDERAPATFALYKSFQQDLRKGEPYESLRY